jgi:uncharacterized cupredoxin-like copper-binding protein
MRIVTRVVVAAAIAVAVTGGGFALQRSTRAGASSALGPGLVTVDVGIHHSRFSFAELHARPGTVVRFLVHNDDPIHHEFIVGDAAVHARHEAGSEAVHPPVPGEVSVAPDDVGETFYRFDKPGRYEFACHLPGHYAYGMHGWVIVAPR